MVYVFSHGLGVSGISLEITAHFSYLNPNNQLKLLWLQGLQGTQSWGLSRLRVQG